MNITSSKETIHEITRSKHELRRPFRAVSCDFVDRMGIKGFAIYRSIRKTVAQPFDVPERLVAIEGFVEAPTLSADGRSLYYHKKEGELFVIYRVTREAVRPRARNNGR